MPSNAAMSCTASSCSRVRAASSNGRSKQCSAASTEILLRLRELEGELLNEKVKRKQLEERIARVAGSETGSIASGSGIVPPSRSQRKERSRASSSAAGSLSGASSISPSENVRQYVAHCALPTVASLSDVTNRGHLPPKPPQKVGTTRSTSSRPTSSNDATAKHRRKPSLPSVPIKHTTPAAVNAKKKVSDVDVYAHHRRQEARQQRLDAFGL